MSLSEKVAVTLALDGPAPLRLDPPASWLADETEAVWRITPSGPPTVEPRPGGRERWAARFRLDPFVPGDGVVQFAPVGVTAGGDPPREARFPPLEVRVVTSLVNPTAADARPVTGVEDPPPSPVESRERPGRVWLAFALVAAAGVMLAAARGLRRRTPPTPAAWAVAELDRLEGELVDKAMSPTVALDRLSAVVRSYLERTADVPATRRTTTELPAADWRAVLGPCDAARFAGGEPSADECVALVGAARRLVEATRGGS